MPISSDSSALASAASARIGTPAARASSRILSAIRPWPCATIFGALSVPCRYDIAVARLRSGGDIEAPRPRLHGNGGGPARALGQPLLQDAGGGLCQLERLP